MELYESGKVTKFKECIRSFSAVVIGSKPYNVSGEARRFDYGNCDCYLGQNDELCKHLVALAIYAVMRGKKLKVEDKKAITGIVTDLPVSPQTTKLLIDLLLRLDEKLCRGGIDDSNGTVGGFVESVVGVLKKYARLDPACVKAFKKLADKETCFGWEAPLVEILDNDD